MAIDDNRKLYVEFRLYFNPMTNQDLLRTCAEQFQEEVYNVWEDGCDEQPIPSIHDVTFEIVMEVDGKHAPDCHCETCNAHGG